MFDLIDRLEHFARRHYLDDDGIHAVLTEAAAEIRRLILLTGQPDIDRCERIERLEAELADCRLLHTELSRRLLKSMEPEVAAVVRTAPAAAEAETPALANTGNWYDPTVRPVMIDGLGVIEDEAE